MYFTLILKIYFHIVCNFRLASIFFGFHGYNWKVINKNNLIILECDLFIFSDWFLRVPPSTYTLQCLYSIFTIMFIGANFFLCIFLEEYWPFDSVNDIHQFGDVFSLVSLYTTSVPFSLVVLWDSNEINLRLD